MTYMTYDQTLEQLKSHVGGLVRVVDNGKIGLLLNAIPRKVSWGHAVVIDVLLDGTVKSYALDESFLSFFDLIGADDAS